MNYLPKPPIVEALLDIDCDMSPNFAIGACAEQAQSLYNDKYPIMRKRVLHQQQIRQVGEDMTEAMAHKADLTGLLFSQKDERQLVQVRTNGFSFNRLAPYTTLDDYFPEIERTWTLFVSQFRPLQILRLRLRYINRIVLPLRPDGKLELDDYLTVGPRLPEDSRLEFSAFMHHYQMDERDTANHAKIILASQPPVEAGLPVIFDIEALNPANCEPLWNEIKKRVDLLRHLKNHIFHRSLTDKCTALFLDN